MSTLQVLIVFFIVAVVIRFASLLLSISNEKKLKQRGAVEHGRTNSFVMLFLHILFYNAAFVEGILKRTQVDQITVIGMFIYGFSVIILVAVVFELRDLWTAKLLLAKGHCLIKSFLFKYIRHPNYFLNIFPELIGFGLVYKAWWSLVVILPIYMVTLTIRIIQEERVMRQRFPEY